MRIERIDAIDELEARWRSIEARRPSLPVFQSWAWNGAWARIVIPEMRGGRLRSYAALSDAGGELAVIPCFGRTVIPKALTVSRLLGDRMSFANDIVCAEPEDEELARAVFRRLGEELGGGEVVHLKHMAPSSPFTRALIAGGAAEVQCRRMIVPRGDGEPDPMKRLSRKRRRTLRWQTNRLARHFDSHRYAVVPADEVGAGFDRFVRFHQGRFRDRDGATLLQGANLRFLRAVFLSLCREGRAEIFELRVEERPIATLLGLLDNGRYYTVNSGFDVSFERYSPMKLLLTEAMRRAFQDLSCERFELGPDYEGYKEVWRPEREESFTAYLCGSAVRSRIGAAAYRALWRRRAGAGA